MSRQSNSPTYRFEQGAFRIENYNQARPFSSFLPGIAGEYGKPLWVFYTNRGQCIASFGVRNKNGAMLEFYPANKAYTATPLLGFRTFLRFASRGDVEVYEPFQNAAALTIRPEEIQIEERNLARGVAIRVTAFNAPNESLPMLIRRVEIENIGRKPLTFDVLDGLPQIVPYGLNEGLLKAMSRTMEAFAEVLHVDDRLPFFKLKIEPSDKPEIEWITRGFFSFSLVRAADAKAGKSCAILVDPRNIFGSDTSFKCPLRFLDSHWRSSAPQQTESLSACCFSYSTVRLRPGQAWSLENYYGQAETWDDADRMRRRLEREPGYASAKRRENTALVSDLIDAFPIHAEPQMLDAYSRQTFLDNTLRGGQPFVLPSNEVFHYYTRKHGDMERDYNFFELAPTTFSQGNGNFRDVNQNRRSENWLFPNVDAANIETFFNLIQLDGFNPLVIQYETFALGEKAWSGVEPLFNGDAAQWRTFFARPFKPGELFERLNVKFASRDKARDALLDILSRADKTQEAAHGEGYWTDHWTYNLDLLESYAALYPDRLRKLFVERRDFTYYDNDHIVQPRHKKYVQLPDGRIRQSRSVVVDKEKTDLIRSRKTEPNAVRVRQGRGPVYRTSLLAKYLGLIAIKAASLDPFGLGLEMEADKPGWCDALNGLPGLFGSSVNESFELRRWVRFLSDRLNDLMGRDEGHRIAQEVAEFIKAVRETLSLARPDDFFKSWDTLASLRERFREQTRLGLSGDEKNLSKDDIQSFLSTLTRFLDVSLSRAFDAKGLCTTYFINEVSDCELLPTSAPSDLKPDEKAVQTVKALAFKQIPVSPFLEGPMHALRVSRAEDAPRLYKAVKASELYDKKLGMFKLNVPLTRESFELGRNKIFTPGWLENESVFLHMAYKFLLETLRSGLAEEFFDDLRTGLVAFQDPRRYGRSPLENSSFIASSRFPDARLHGGGFVARLTGATAEWISMVLHMGLGAQPFRIVGGQLRFEPRPVLARWLFTKKKIETFDKGTFGFKLFGKTWIVYRNPSGRDTFGAAAVKPSEFHLRYADGREKTVHGGVLGETEAAELRDGKLTRVTIELR